MADLVRQQLEDVPRTMRSRYRDMGDGMIWMLTNN